MGLQNRWGKKANIFTFGNYKQSLIKAKEDTTKFKEVIDMIKGQTIVDCLSDDFYLLWKIKNLFVNAPTYEKYTKLDIAYKKMVSYKYPSNHDWNILIQLV